MQHAAALLAELPEASYEHDVVLWAERQARERLTSKGGPVLLGLQLDCPGVESARRNECTCRISNGGETSSKKGTGTMRWMATILWALLARAQARTFRIHVCAPHGS